MLKPSSTVRRLAFAALAPAVFWACERRSIVAVDVATVQVSPSALSIPPGGSGQLTAQVLDENGDVLPGRTVSWSSDDGSVATVNQSGLVSATGNGSAVITATAGGVNGTATVSVNVTGSIQLSLEEVTFETEEGGGVAPVNVAVTNGGSGSLTNVQHAEDYGGGVSGWLSLSLNQNVTPATLTVGTNAGVVSGLGPGQYSATVMVSANNASNSPVSLPVVLTITTPDPAIGLNPSSRAFAITQGASSAPSQTVSVSNVGGGSLTGLARSIQYGSGASGWLSASLNRTSAPATLTLSLNTSVSSLGVGVYTANVRVTSPVAGNSPQTVSVSLIVGDAPAAIGLDSTSVSFQAVEGVDPAGKSVGVTNLGGGSLTGITVTDDATWLTATRQSGTAPTDIDLAVDVTGLAAGDYNATVTVTSPVATNSPQTFDVSLEVLGLPVIVLARDTVTFEGAVGGGDPTAVNIAVTNGGEADLTGLAAAVASYGSGQPTGWLAAQIVGSTTAPTTVRLTPSVGTLTEGTYAAVVEVTSSVPGVTRDTIDVTFVVEVAPPAAPTDADRESGTTSSITVSFQDNADNETGFGIRRQLVSGGAWTALADPGPSAGSGGRVQFTDTGLASGTRYRYQMWAVNASGTSDTLTAVFRTRPSGPSSVSASATNNTTVQVSWTSGDGDGVTFDVQHKLAEESTYSALTTGLASTATSYTHNGAADGRTHDYRVVARIPAPDSGAATASAATGLNPPSGLTATSTAAGTTINLSWNDDSASEDGYEIRRSIAPATPNTAVATVGVGVEAYASPVTPGVPYRFRVCTMRGATRECGGTVDETATGVDLEMSVTASPGAITQGQTSTFTAVVTNNGPSAATGVGVTITADAGLSWNSDNQGWGGTGDWTVGSLASGASATINVVYTANAMGTLSVSVSATANEAETNAGDESDSASVSVS